MVQHSAHMHVMHKAIRSVSGRLVRDFGELEQLQVSQKGTSDFAKKSYDRTKEKLLAELAKGRPTYGIKCDNHVIAGEDERYNWLVAPILGKANFEHGFDFFGIAVGLEEIIPGGKSQTLAATVLMPMQKELFTADKSEGLWLEGNNRGAGVDRLYVANRTSLNNMLIGINQEVPIRQNTRFLGDDLLTCLMVAAGRLDGCVLPSISEVDYCISRLLIAEARGYVEHRKERLIASNEQVSDALRRSFA